MNKSPATPRPTHSMTDIITQATLCQNKAAQPDTSVWVSANAGTGKTHVLINRILRLLLENEHCTPQNILALTYTNAAAAEMRERLQHKIETLTALPATQQQEELTKLLGYTPGQSHIITLNTLARTQRDTPLQAQTVHAFCQKFLHVFPLEAEIPPNFDLLIDPEHARQLNQVMDNVLHQSMAGDNALNSWYTWLAQNMAPQTLREELLAIVFAMPKLNAVIQGYGGEESYETFLAATLGLDKSLLPTPHQVASEFSYQLTDIDYKNLNGIKNAILSSGKKVKFADTVNDMLANWPRVTAKSYVNLFITAKNKVNSRLPKVAEIQAVAAALEDKIAMYHAQRTYIHTMALIYMGTAIHTAFAQFKQQHGYVDYTDLIHHALHVLTNTSQREWVHFKLDSRIQHVLLDEGQDIDTEQWQLLQAIIQDFYSGEGGHDAPRTLFAVGDIKQAIYRFRGSVPAIFNAIWDEKLSKLPPPFATLQVDMHTSFRCAPAILDVVDQVMQTAGVETYHQSSRVGNLGRVEVWPLIKTDATRASKQTEFSWHIPTAVPQRNATPRAQLMQLVAAKIKELLNSSAILPSTGKPISAGDIYVLVRTRTALPELISSLSQAGIPYTGLDQEDGMNHPMVQDMHALLEWLLRPDNNVLTAHVLRSPLVGITEEQWLELHTISKQRNISYFAALEENMPSVYAMLAELRARTPSASPHAALTLIMQHFDVRKRYWRHYFPEGSTSSGQYIYQLCAILLEHAADTGGNISAYIQLLAENGLKLPQSLVQANAVRLLTAHQAKGLEAPVVFLPDTTQRADERLHKDTLLWHYTSAITPALVVDNPSEERRTVVHEKLREEERKRLTEDNLNLFYVAMTRAKDMLFIGGALGRGQKPPPSSWYAMIQKACENEAVTGWELPPNGLYVYTTGTPPKPDSTVIEIEENSSPEVCVENLSWLHAPLHANNAVPLQQNTTTSEATIYGEAVHWVLEHVITFKALPTAAAVALKFPTCDSVKALAEAKQCVEKYPKLTDAQARAEVSIGAGGSVWRLDYLHISADTITIIDFKTHSPVPEDVPQEIIQQLGRYKNYVQQLYPQHTVRTGVLWTHTANLVWLADNAFSALDI